MSIVAVFVAVFVKLYIQICCYLQLIYSIIHVDCTSPVHFDLESPLSEQGHGDSGFSPMQDERYGGTLKVGDLIKTSKSRSNDKIHGPPRKRRFRVTEEAIEYFQQFSHVSCYLVL